MRFNRFVVLSLAVCAATLAAQEPFDRDAYARDHVRFLVQQLEQWTKDFPQAFNAALLKPPVDASKLPEAAKSGGEEFTRSVKRLVELSPAHDVLTSAAFKSELQKTLASMKEVNQAFGSQRFPALLQNDWDQVRSTLNDLARVYRVEALAIVEPPQAGNGGRGPATAAAAGGISGYIVDLSCAKKGKGMWANAACVASCLRDGDKAVLVTEDGKVFQIANQDKIPTESYGQIVTVTGKTVGETITIQAVKM